MNLKPVEKLVRFASEGNLTGKQRNGTAFQQVSNQKARMIQVVDFVETSFKDFIWKVEKLFSSDILLSNQTKNPGWGR